MCWPVGQPLESVTQCPSTMCWPAGQVVTGGFQPAWAGFLRPIPWLRSHSDPAWWWEPSFNWPGGFLLSALPTQPAHGLPVALPPPFPLPDALPSRVEQYDPQSPPLLAPPGLWSAFDWGCGCVGSPDVPAVPDVTWLAAVLPTGEVVTDGAVMDAASACLTLPAPLAWPTPPLPWSAADDAECDAELPPGAA